MHIDTVIEIFDNIIQGFEKAEEVTPQIKADIDAVIEPFKKAYHLIVSLLKGETDGQKHVLVLQSLLERAEKISKSSTEV